MSTYRRLLKVGWALYWRSIVWELVFGLPPMLVMAVFINNLYRPGTGRDRAYAVCVPVVASALSIFSILPHTFRGALRAKFRGFSVRVRRRGGAVSPYALSYAEELQAASLMTALSLTFAAAGWALDYDLPTLGLFSRTNTPDQFLLCIFLINPLLSLALLRVPFRGFQLEIAPQAAVPASPIAKQHTAAA